MVSRQLLRIVKSRREGVTKAVEHPRHEQYIKAYYKDQLLITEVTLAVSSSRSEIDMLLFRETNEYRLRNCRTVKKIVND